MDFTRSVFIYYQFRQLTSLDVVGRNAVLEYIDMCLDMIAERSPQMKKAVGVLKEISADERTRMLYEEREKARRDMVSRLSGAKREGKREQSIEIARNAIKMGLDTDVIITLTGLTREEAKNLNDVIVPIATKTLATDASVELH